MLALLGMSSSQLTFTPSFFRGVGQPPTRQDLGMTRSAEVFSNIRDDDAAKITGWISMCHTGQWGNRLGPMVGENGLMFGDVSDDIENYCMMVATFV